MPPGVASFGVPSGLAGRTRWAGPRVGLSITPGVIDDLLPAPDHPGCCRSDSRFARRKSCAGPKPSSRNGDRPSAWRGASHAVFRNVALRACSKSTPIRRPRRLSQRRPARRAIDHLLPIRRSRHRREMRWIVLRRLIEERRPHRTSPRRRSPLRMMGGSIGPSLMVEGNVGIGSGQDVVSGVACHCAPSSQAGDVTEGSSVGDTGAGHAGGADCAKFSQRRFINGDVGRQSSIAKVL